MADKKKTAEETSSEAKVRAADERQDERAEAAQAATDAAEAAGKLPESMAVTNPAPATEVDGASGTFIEPEIKAAIPLDHPAIDNNPRAGTSALQNGGDFNDPRHLDPNDPEFKGQGLDLSVYGDAKSPEKKG